MRASVVDTTLLMLAMSVSLQSQTAAPAASSKPTVDLSGIWMTNVNYTTVWEVYNGPWTPEKLAAYDQNVPRPRRAQSGAAGAPRAALPKMTPWAAAIFSYNGSPDDEGEGRRNEVDTYSHCSPPGVPRNWAIRRPYEIFQEANRVIIIFEGDHWIRQIWTDGRGHSPNPGHTWGGDSIGKWEKETLVVDTIGFNDRSWMDIAGHPHSDALHLTERIRRVAPDRLQIIVTAEDPKAFTEPWTGMYMAVLRPTWELGEVIPCEDVILGHPIPKISGMPVHLRPKR